MSLFNKILLSMLLVALVPLLTTSLLLSFNLGKVRETLSARIAETSDRQASESLRLHAEQVAEDIAILLKNCENDVTLLASLHASPALLKQIYDSRTSEIWYRRGTLFGPREIREWVPLYSSLAVIDARGHETFVIDNGTILPPGRFRDVSDPRNTEFLSEDYFDKTKRLKPDEVYVSHVTGFHVGKEEQLAGATDPEHAVDGEEFRGVVRFATQVKDERGRFNGIVVLSLDHRHLMERSQHILPGGNSRTVFPSYKSGNYAFIFDDEGWIITHPKFWDIRGVDRAGKLVPPYSAQSSREDIEAGRIPYNLDHAGFIHPNYPIVARMVRAKQSGYVDVTNVGGAKKIMAFAPIHYSTGDYSRHGIFGAVTIGFQVDQFRELARTGVALINRQLQDHIRASIIIALTCLMVGLGAWALSRGITRPLGLLMQGSREMASGVTGKRVPIRTNDEIGELASDFNMMADELERRKDRLLTTLDELENSRREILAERNFKEEVLESISSAILTFAPSGTLLSVNNTGRQLLGESVSPGQHFTDIFQGWSDMAERIAQVLDGVKAFGREPLIVRTAEDSKHFSAGFFPIKGGAEAAITITIRDDTEKERMREEMTRMDRLASLGKLAAGLAHEIRNPLTGVSLLLDDLHDRAAPESECQLLMGKALGEIERVERLITSLLNFSSPPKAQFHAGDINGVVNDTLLLLRRECDRQGVTLQYDPGEVPTFRFDKEKIKQAVLNLLKNAMEALPEGGTITVCTTATHDTVSITVTDDGPGIPAENLPLIFEPFFTCKGAGTGLGLSITERIVQEHHGRVTVDTSEKGTAFTLTLPIADGSGQVKN